MAASFVKGSRKRTFDKTNENFDDGIDMLIFNRILHTVVGNRYPHTTSTCKVTASLLGLCTVLCGAMISFVTGADLSMARVREWGNVC